MITSTPSKVVGMAELAFSDSPGEVMACVGLGSCIGLTAYDRINKIGGMVHIVLPSSRPEDPTRSPKFADTAVPLLIEGMVSRGAYKSRLEFKMAGGAQMAKAGGSPIFQVGDRNIEAVTVALKKAGVQLTAQDTGGQHGRTVRMYMDTGEMEISSATRDSIQL